jgi:hypothetical protein
LPCNDCDIGDYVNPVSGNSSVNTFLRQLSHKQQGTGVLSLQFVPRSYKKKKIGGTSQLRRAAGNILIKQSQTAGKGWLGVWLTTHRKSKLVMNIQKRPRNWMDSLDKRHRRKRMDMRFGMLNVRSTYRAGSLRAVGEEISKYMLFGGRTGGQMGQRWH